MNPQILIDLTKEFFMIMGEVSLPMLLAALVVGLTVSVFQAVTQINEATLSFLPKMATIVFVFMLISPWMIGRMKNYTIKLYERIPTIGRNL
jgi:flagellar biosynthetic protein FliQ